MPPRYLWASRDIKGYFFLNSSESFRESRLHVVWLSQCLVFDSFCARLLCKFKFLLHCAIEKKFKSKDYGLVPKSPGHLRWLPSLDCHDRKYFDKICLKNDFSIVSKVHLAFKKVFFYLFNVKTMFCTRFVIEKRK